MMVQMHDCLAATLVTDTEGQTDDDQKGQTDDDQTEQSVGAALQKRATTLWPAPKKDWPDPKNARNCARWRDLYPSLKAPTCSSYLPTLLFPNRTLPYFLIPMLVDRVICAFFSYSYFMVHHTT